MANLAFHNHSDLHCGFPRNDDVTLIAGETLILSHTMILCHFGNHRDSSSELVHDMTIFVYLPKGQTF